jgi:iron uptake system component EfeO
MRTASYQNWYHQLVVSIVSGLAFAAPAGATTLDEGAERYRTYLVEDIGKALAGAQSLRDFVVSKNVAQAKMAWIEARAGWERSEVFTSGFVPELDDAIDAWPDATAGFHAIEAKLFGADRADAEGEINALIRHLTDVHMQLHDIPLTPQGLLNGIARLAYEVGDSKVDGGESRLSGTSLNDMRSNAEGIELAYQTVFASALKASDPGLAQAVQSEIRRLKVLLDAHDLRSVDPEKLRQVTEELVVTLQSAGPKIGLSRPALEEVIK